MDKVDLKELVRVLSTLEKTIGQNTKERALTNRKLDTLNENLGRLCDKIGTYIQLQQN